MRKSPSAKHTAGGAGGAGVVVTTGVVDVVVGMGVVVGGSAVLVVVDAAVVVVVIVVAVVVASVVIVVVGDGVVVVVVGDDVVVVVVGDGVVVVVVVGNIARGDSLHANSKPFRVSPRLVGFKLNEASTRITPVMDFSLYVLSVCDNSASIASLSKLVALLIRISFPVPSQSIASKYSSMAILTLSLV